MKSFLKDFNFEEIMSWKPRTDFLEGNSHTDEFNKNLKEVTDMVNSLEASTVDDKDKISGELIDIIQLTRRVAYSAIREAEYIKAGRVDEDKEEAILKNQKNFDKTFKKKLKDYLLEAEVNNIANEAYREFQISKGVTEDKIKTIGPELMKIFVDAAKKTEDNCRSISVRLDATLEKRIGHMLDAYHHVVDAFSCVNIYSDKLKYEKFCNYIFYNGPDVTSKQILFAAGIPEIKKGVLVSFLRIILYPLTFVVDYLDKKRIYGLDELRLFKDGKEKPRDEKEAKRLKQERWLNYSSLVGASLREVEVGKGEKQQYAVLDCFKGDKPPNGTVIVFHGKNADIHTKSLIDNYKSICKGYRVIMMEYPGFESSDGLLSKENISKVTYQLFEDAKRKDLIKGDVTVMGEDFGCYYAALLAKKIDEKERGSCKGLMLSGQFIDNTSDLSTFGKIASYISDAEHLDTGSVLRSLPITITLAFLVSGRDSIARIYPVEIQKPYNIWTFPKDTKVPVVNYNGDSETEIADKESQLNELKKYLLETSRIEIKSDEVLVCGKKPFSASFSASASPVSDQKEQGPAK